MKEYARFSRNLLTAKQFVNKHPAWTEASIRNLIFHSRDRKTSKGIIPGNGLESAILRVGRKVLIDEARFFEWVDAQNGLKSQGGAK